MKCKEAKALGLKTYNTGKACPAHAGKMGGCSRYVRSGSCVEKSRERNQSDAGKESKRKYASKESSRLKKNARGSAYNKLESTKKRAKARRDAKKVAKVKTLTKRQQAKAAAVLTYQSLSKCEHHKERADNCIRYTVGGGCVESMSAYSKSAAQTEKAKAQRQTPEAKAARKKYHKTYKKSERQKLAGNLRARLKSALRTGQKIGSAVSDLGMPVDDFRLYLEALFQPGMTWQNYGRGKEKWQIDHIKPLCSFDLTDREQFLEACHYTNPQPLWHHDHAAKTTVDRKLAYDY